MKKITRLALGALLLGQILSPRAALACACCAESGHRHKTNVTIAHEVDALSKLVLAENAKLFTTVCVDDCIKGIRWSASAQDKPAVKMNVSPNHLTLNVNENSPSHTILRAALPKTYAYSAIDPKPGESSGPDIDLYTESRFDLQIYGEGPGWTGGDAAVPARLIFMGPGNLCPNINNASNWLLDIGGPKANAQFRLFGKVQNAKP